MKCKPYSEITVEIRRQLKTVKITSNIFAVYNLVGIKLNVLDFYTIGWPGGGTIDLACA